VSDIRERGVNLVTVSCEPSHIVSFYFIIVIWALICPLFESLTHVYACFIIAVTSVMLCREYTCLQGLFEYVRPSWEERPRPCAAELDLKSFGSTTPDRPTATDTAVSELKVDGTVLPA